MRRNPSATERRLWKLLRDRKLEGLKFRRQVPIGPYFADFVCLSCRIIVEADGPLHDEDHDAKRDAWLASQRFLVLRFPNRIIEGDPQGVFAAVLAAAKNR
jgi:very-short-patch-repair endonuclease